MFRVSTALTLGICMLLSACGGAPRTAGEVAPKHPDAQWQGRNKTGKAIGLLNKGDSAGARILLLDILKHQPGDQLVRNLVDEIDRDPKDMLGAANFAYTSKAGDSFSSLAERFLRNPSLFYALARYNGVGNPSLLQPGTNLRIPGHEKKEGSLVPRAAAKVPEHAVPEKAPPPKTAIDPKRAHELRAAGLVQLNRGQISRAVAMLQQANLLDPANPLIKRDLERAMRIRRTVEGK